MQIEQLGGHTFLRRFAGCILAVFTAAWGGASLYAQEFPVRPLTIVVPTAPGGPLDILARLLQSKLTSIAGQSVVVDNKPGASTYIGGEYVAKSNPDGHTVLMQAEVGLFPELFVKGLTTIQSTELIPVAPMGSAPFLLFTPSQVPARDLREFVTLVRANPGKYNLAAFSGSYLTLAMLSFLKANNMEMLTVPYNSTANIITAMLRDEAHLYIGAISGPKANIDAGKLRGLALVATKRSNALSGVPTAKELGFDLDISGDYIVLVPAKTPAATVRILNNMIARAMDSNDARDRLIQLGFDPLTETPEFMAAKFSRLNQDVRRTVKELGVEPQ